MKPRLHPEPSGAPPDGFGTAEIQERKDFLEFGQADIDRLSSLHESLEAGRFRFADAFYAHLLTFPPLRHLLPDEQSLDQLRRAQTAYFSRLTAGEYGDAYVANRLLVGHVHHRIGLDPKWYIGAYRKYLSGLMPLVWEASGGNSRPFFEAFDSLLKIVLFDMGLALDSYFQADQQALLELKNYADRVIDTLPSGLLVFDAQLRLRTVNRAALGMLGGAGAAPEIGRSLEELLPHEPLHALAREIVRHHDEGGQPVRGPLVEQSGRMLAVTLAATTIDEAPALIVQLQDETARKQAEATLHLAQRALESSGNGIIIADALSPDHPVVYVNAAFERITGYGAAEAVGRNCRFLRGKDSSQPGLAILRQAIEDKREARVVLRNYRKDGTLFWNELLVAPVRAEDGTVTHFVGVQNDISAQKRAEENLMHMATHDALTGLPNRSLLQDRIGQAIGYAERMQREVAVLFLDLDRFKNINDSLGHATGDALIGVVASRLRDAVRAADTVARIGGDEFVIVLTDVTRESDITQVLPNLIAAVAEPVTVDGHELSVTASIGISTYPHDGRDAISLLKNADTAMYRAKEAGRNEFRFYAHSMNANAVDRLRLENDLRKAIKEDELTVFYQPQVETGTGRVVGAEALLRWQHPRHGLIPPADFIPMAEETGLIVPIGEWVVRRVCAQLRQWIDAGLPRIVVAVNLSPRQFHQPNVVEMISGAVSEYALPAELLELEITESSLMRDPAEAEELLGRLSERGFSLSIDDFGTGYSSLGYLKRFPLNALKIDRSFVADIEHNRDSATIASAIIALAHSLGLKVVAEGVEHASQMAVLQALKCDLGQGFLHGKPMASEEFVAFLNRK